MVMSPNATYQTGELVKITDDEIVGLMGSALGVVKEVKYNEQWKTFYYKIEPNSHAHVAQAVSVREDCLAKLSTST